MKRRRLIPLLLGVALALLMLEVALQVGAYVIWKRRSAESAVQGAILCVGDSFTYGLGATGDGGSFPRQLEAALRNAGRAVDVVNAGWPGQSSREVLMRLPEQLARHRPRTVCVLVGINDPVSRPARVRVDELVAEAGDGFVWRPRLLQVFSMMGDWLRDKREVVRGFVGTWHAADFEVTFERDGRVLMGKDELRWLEDENGVVLLFPTGTQPMQWEIKEGRLALRTPTFAHQLEPGKAPAPSALVRGQKALAQGDVAQARDLLQQALAVVADVGAAREALVRIAVQTGDAAARERWLGELRSGFARTGTVADGAALAHALAASDLVPEALDVAERVLAAFPDCLRAWDVLLTHGLASGARARVLACMQRVLSAARGDEVWRPTLLQMRASLRQKEEPVEALHDLFMAFALTADRPFLQRQIEVGAADYTPQAREAALARLAPELATTVRAAIDSATGEAGVYATLRAHLERIVALCRARDAEVWLLSYPEPDATRDQLVAGVAAATGARFLSLHARFTELLQTTPRATLFIADGHCTDRGYGEMAAQVAAALR